MLGEKNDKKAFSVTIFCADACNRGWKYYKGHCYLLRKEPKAFNDAVRACEETGGYLTQISSNAENDFVVSLLNNANKDIWIGYFKRDEKWVWVITQTPLPYYTNWDVKSYISTSDGDCALIWSHWKGKKTWDNRNCLSKKWFVCKAGESTVQRLGFCLASAISQSLQAALKHTRTCSKVKRQFLWVMETCTTTS